MSDGMKKIQPLDSLGKEEFFRPASRLIEAQYKQYRSYHERPIQRDMFAEYDAIAAWSTVTCCYSGIEQAMKCLLQMRDAYIDQSLCQACFKRVQGKGSEECKKVNKCGYKEHYEGSSFKPTATLSIRWMTVGITNTIILGNYFAPSPVRSKMFSALLTPSIVPCMITFPRKPPIAFWMRLTVATLLGATSFLKAKCRQQPIPAPCSKSGPP